MARKKNRVLKQELKQELKQAPPRNPLFNHPLMKKSHVHDKSNKAKRRNEKVKLARDWYSQNGLLQTFLRIPVFAA